MQLDLPCFARYRLSLQFDVARLLSTGCCCSSTFPVSAPAAWCRNSSSLIFHSAYCRSGVSFPVLSLRILVAIRSLLPPYTSAFPVHLGYSSACRLLLLFDRPCSPLADAGGRCHSIFPVILLQIDVATRCPLLRALPAIVAVRCCPFTFHVPLWQLDLLCGHLCRLAALEPNLVYSPPADCRSSLIFPV